MTRRKPRHAVKHAGPEQVTVPELQQRFERAEDERYSTWAETIHIDNPWWISEPGRLTVTERVEPIPDGPPYVYGRDFHLGDRRGSQDEYDLGDHVPTPDPAQRLHDRIAQIRPLIHEITKET